MYFVYVLKSSKFDRYYVGLSSNINARLKEHNSGSVKSTKSFVPWVILHYEEFDTRSKAREREKYFKTAAGRRWRKENLGD